MLVFFATCSQCPMSKQEIAVLLSVAVSEGALLKWPLKLRCEQCK